jgi:poly-gamma-glutamate synthesis protein (capsule biosynthesis protein)
VNFEAPLASENLNPAAKAGPVIRQPNTAITHCRNLGITHCSMANNHIMDYGRDGLEETFSRLPGITIIGAGLSFDEAYQPSWFESEGRRIALLSFAEAQFGVLQDEQSSEQAGYAWIDHPRARLAVSAASKKADYVIVQAHAGLEMVDLPLPEWRSRYREFIDLGADLVIGHHPHVIQGSECYKQKMIHYSLGNFFMSVMMNQSNRGSGAALQVTIDQSGLDSRIIPLQCATSSIDLDTSSKAAAHYDSLSNRLLDQQTYDSEIDSICDEFWNKTYSRYYETALMGMGTKPGVTAGFRMLRQLAATMVKWKINSPDNELMLIHNIRIESHRWVAARALANRIKES